MRLLHLTAEEAAELEAIWIEKEAAGIPRPPYAGRMVRIVADRPKPPAPPKSPGPKVVPGYVRGHQIRQQQYREKRAAFLEAVKTRIPIGSKVTVKEASEAAGVPFSTADMYVRRLTTDGLWPYLRYASGEHKPKGVTHADSVPTSQRSDRHHHQRRGTDHGDGHRHPR